MSAEEGVSGSSLVERILKVYPDFRIEKVSLNTDGQNSSVLVVNKAWIFRFPKYEHVLKQMKVENGLLKAIQGQLPLKIPEPTYTHLDDAEVRESFMGYRCIPGEPLWRETFWSIQDNTEVERLADQLGEFLQILHSTPEERLRGLDLGQEETRAGIQDLFERIRQKLFPLMCPEARRWAVGHFESFLEKDANFTFQPALRHGDFGTSNLIYDNSSGRLNGVIDFSFAALGDPAFDFAGLFSSYGEAFIERCERSYPGLEAMMERVRFYKGTFALEEALFGYENGDEDALEAGLRTYRQPPGSPE